MSSLWDSSGDSTFPKPTLSLSILWWAFELICQLHWGITLSNGNIALWHFHEAYKALDLEAIDEYPKKCLINQFDVIPKFDGNPLSIVAHIFEFTRCIYYANVLHEYVFLQLFLLSLGNEQRYWINHSWKPRIISSLTILIREFLKHWGPETQSLKDTIQDLEAAFSREGFDLDPIEGLI